MGRSHRVNQDAGGAWTWTRDDGSPASLIAVADGVSAGQRSEEASRTAIQHLQSTLEPLMSSTIDRLGTLREALVGAALEAHHMIARRGNPEGAEADATTLVAAVCVGYHGVGIWCGDSRVYHVNGGTRIERVTQDHSWADGVVNSGILTAEQASRDPRAHMITRWLGPPDRPDPGIDVFRFNLSQGDVLFCCSDGLYTYYVPPYGEEKEMANAFGRRTVSEAVERLTSLAFERGGRDDITVAALRLTDDAS